VNADTYKIDPVHSSIVFKSKHIDVRLVAATNRDLDAMVASGQFRGDLYHRLAVFPIQLPPLRARRQDILPLAVSLLARISADLGRPALRLDDRVRERLLEGSWPGNVRELSNTLERAAILADGDVVRGEDLQISIAPPVSGQADTIEEIERQAIRRALDEVGGLATETVTVGNMDPLRSGAASGARASRGPAQSETASHQRRCTPRLAAHRRLICDISALPPRACRHAASQNPGTAIPAARRASPG